MLLFVRVDHPNSSDATKILSVSSYNSQIIMQCRSGNYRIWQLYFMGFLNCHCTFYYFIIER